MEQSYSIQMGLMNMHDWVYLHVVHLGTYMYSHTLLHTIWKHIVMDMNNVHILGLCIYGILTT